jgi:hypothetical protein
LFAREAAEDREGVHGCAGGLAEGAAAVAEGAAVAEDGAGASALGGRPTSSQPMLPFSEWQR